jgi:putative transposase
MNSRNRTPSEYIQFSLYFYFLGLSLRRSSERLSSHFIKRNHVYLSGTGYKNIILRKYPLKEKENLSEYSCIQKDETIIKVGSEFIWLWIAAIEFESKEILGMRISKERKICSLQNDLCRKLWMNMVNIQFQQTAVLGIHKHVDS